MATDAQNLTTTRSAILAELAGITTDSPNYSVDGQQVERRRKGLLEDLKMLNEMLAALQGPVEEVSEAAT